MTCHYIWHNGQAIDSCQFVADLLKVCGIQSNSSPSNFDPFWDPRFLDNEDKKKLSSKIEIKSLDLQIDNQFSYGEKFNTGLSEFNFLNLKGIAEYKANKNYFEFKLLDKAKNSKFS